MPTKTRRTLRKSTIARLRKQLDTSLAALTQAELVRLLASPEIEYIFKHALIQDTAYSSLLKHDRYNLHLDVAHALENLYAERCIDEYAALLAGHYAAAGDDEKTLEYATRAANEAYRLYALPEAIQFYSLALDAASRVSNTPTQTLVHLYYQRGQALFSNSQWREAWASYEEMERAAHARNDHMLELWSLVERTVLRSIFSPLNDANDAHALADRALPMADELGDRAARSKLLWALMRVTVIENNAELAVRYGDEAVALARELGLREQTIYILGDLQYAYRSAGRLTDALTVLQESVAAWRELGNQHMLADNLNQTAFILISQGEMERAQEYINQALTLSRQTNNATQEVLSLFLTAQFANERGEVATALEDILRAERTRSAFAIGPMGIYSTSIYRDLGETKYPIELIEQTRDTVMNSGLRMFLRNGVYTEMAHFYLQAGDLTSAENALSQVQTRRGAIDQSVLFAGVQPVNFIQAELHLARGESERAAELLEQLIAQYEPMGLLRILPETYLLLAQTRIAQGDWSRTAAALTRGQQLAEHIGSRRILWKIFAAWSELYAKQGNIPLAEQFRAQARALIEYIAARTPETWSPDSGTLLHLRQSFLNLPSVRAMLK